MTIILLNSTYHIPKNFMLDDSGYARREWLMTPYVSNIHDPGEVRFNAAHKRTRRLVENAYGVVKARFPCLKKMRLEPTYAGRIIMACAALHNITTREDFWVDAPEAIDSVNVPEPPNNNNRRLNELLMFFR